MGIFSNLLGGRWTPYDIELMLHHHCRRVPFERRDAPIFQDRMDSLVKVGLLEFSDEQQLYVSTPLGAALVEMWCNTPIPAVKYVDPRLDGLGK